MKTIACMMVLLATAVGGCNDEASEVQQDAGAQGGNPGGATLDDEDDGPQPAAEFLVAASGTCPGFVEGDGCERDQVSLICNFAPAGVPERKVRLWFDESARDIQSPLVFFFHGLTRYASDAAAALFGLGETQQAIVDAGGIVVSMEKEEGRVTSATVSPWKLGIQNGLFEPANSGVMDDLLVMDEVVACAEEALGVNSRRIHATGMSAGGLMTGNLIYSRSGYLASVAPFSGGIMGLPDSQDPDHKVPVMATYGGPDDIAVGQNFEMYNGEMEERLRTNGNFFFVCEHSNGHVLDQGVAPFAWQFMQDHPFGVDSPYADGLPSDAPDACSSR